MLLTDDHRDDNNNLHYTLPTCALKMHEPAHPLTVDSSSIHRTLFCATSDSYVEACLNTMANSFFFVTLLWLVTDSTRMLSTTSVQPLDSTTISELKGS